MLTLCSPMLALEMLSPIAVTETAEVGTGGSAAGGARLYNLRLPTEGLRQGHGRVAGARIEGLPPMPPTPLLEVLSIFQNKNLLRSILSVQGGSC